MANEEVLSDGKVTFGQGNHYYDRGIRGHGNWQEVLQALQVEGEIVANKPYSQEFELWLQEFFQKTRLY